MKRATEEKKKPSIQTMERLQTLGAIANRASLASRLGQQYGGDRDVFEALGYPLTITYKDYLARYGRQDIAKAIINRPVNYTWKGPLIITETGNSEETALEKEWATLEKALKLKSKFIRADKLSAIGNYGVIILGFDDVTTSSGFAKKVKVGKRKLNYVKPLGEGSAKISTYVTNTSDPRYGMVETYDIEYENPGEGRETTKFNIHHTRVIHIAPELLESEIEGEPVLRSVWNRLLDLEKLVGGSAEMFWRGARPGYQGEIDPDYTLTSVEEAKLEDQLDEYEHNLRRMLLNSGVKFTALQQQVADPSAHVDVQIQMISAITGIPKRVLVGSERGELASGQDLTSWYSVVQTRREEHADANIISPFVDRMIEYGVLPKPSTGTYQIRWFDLFSASDKDKAEVGRIRATALKEYSQNPTAEFVVPPDAFMEFMLGLNEDERTAIREMSGDLINAERRMLLTPEEEEIEQTTKKVATKPVSTNGEKK